MVDVSDAASIALPRWLSTPEACPTRAIQSLRRATGVIPIVRATSSTDLSCKYLSTTAVRSRLPSSLSRLVQHRRQIPPRLVSRHPPHKPPDNLPRSARDAVVDLRCDSIAGRPGRVAFTSQPARCDSPPTFDGFSQSRQKTACVMSSAWPVPTCRHAAS